ncbi:MAG: aminotransferase class V-fold PLP-dependent enzyme [Gemmatimonadota bacterium]|nr:aminotransferase class V-fold PLP-dependent enzyme [Gemmatimonadota bacterium]
MPAPDRRTFLKRAAGTMAAAAAAPVLTADMLTAAPVFATRPATGTRTGRDLELDRPPGIVAFDELAARARRADAEDEEFWELVKRQFPLSDGLILMNAANLCPSPYQVQETVFRLTRDVDEDASFQNRAKFSDLREASRSALARLMGASPDEIAITRNTSESNNAVLNGLTLGPDDEVVIWDQNHPTNAQAWDVRAERWGFTVHRVSTPRNPTTADELITPFEAAMTDRTRVIAFSHVSNVSGVELPAAELCRRARDRGVYSHVDGAQTFGSKVVDLHALGCDSYTGSAHKWFVGPKEAGLLYVREERVPELWPSVVGVGYDGGPGNGARKFDSLGQRDDAAVAAVETAVAFHEAIGPRLIEERVRALVDGIKHAVRERVPEVTFHTSDAPDRSHGVVVIVLPIENHGEVYGRLYTEHRIAGAPRGGDYPGIRFCPHLYNTMAEVERVADVLAVEAGRA